MINYYLLTKPGIVLGNLVTVAAGFLLASKGRIDLLLFFETLLGITFIMASACVFNNYIDRNIDKKMERTKKRALVEGLISGSNALLFGTILGIFGCMTLFFFTNPLTVLIAVIGFFVYVVLYSFWKCHTVYGTAIGSIAGAVPPVIGYCAVSNQFDAAACILFMIMVLWQMPHFFSIAMFHLDDYTKAGIPVLPICKGVRRTKIHMSLYILAFIPVALMLTLFGYTGYVYLGVISAISFAWLMLCLVGFNCTDDKWWGQQMFRLSLVLIGAMSLAIPLDLRY
ncbi:MAG: heme o synthase [Parachlamydiaceae bacterium]